MTCRDYELELGDLVDGTVAPDRRVVLERHLEGCDSCRALVDDFTAIRDAARDLDVPPPSAEVWNRIAAAVEAEATPRRWWQGPSGSLAWQPVLAAAAMVVLLVGGSWLAFHDAAGTPRAVAAIPAVSEQVEAELALAQQDYVRAITPLEEAARAGADDLDDETAEVMQSNLAVLDAAIDRTRDALRTQPENELAQESLFDALRSKVQFLQDIVALLNEMRKGNTEGAARVVADMNQ